MIAFACPACGKSLKAKDEIAGRKVKCSACGKPVQVPASVRAASPQKSTQPGEDLSAPNTRAVEQATSTPYRLADESVPDAANPTGVPEPQSASATQSWPKESWSFLSPPQGPGELGRLGPYRILQVLGKGGMGVVFRGEDPQLERPVAIKAMLPELASNESAVQRFFREAKAAAALKHPHIVSIYQVGEDKGVPFLAMEFLEGESLHDRLQRERKLPIAEVVRIGRELADGLGAAHEKGLIHRDIKPANIWLEGKEARAKILDFGLARTLSDTAHLTQSGAIIGTPAFMAPEQAAGKQADHRSDLFSLGSVLYCMSSGERPFKGNDTLSLLTALAIQDPRPPAELNAAIPDELSNLILKLLAKEPQKRPQSAQEVLAALKKPRGKRSIDSPPPERNKKRLVPKKVLVSCQVTLAVFMVGIVAVFLARPFSGDTKSEIKDAIALEKKDAGTAVAIKESTPQKGPEPQIQVATKPDVPGVPMAAPSPAKKSPDADVFAFLKASTGSRKLSGQEIYEKVLKSSVCIIGDGGSGSGALINKEDRLVVTNHHVVYAPMAMKPPLPGGFGPPGASPAPPGSSLIAGRLDASCPPDRFTKHRCRPHLLQMYKGEKYRIDMLGEFDTYLRIEDSLGNNLAQDDDSGGNLKARIEFTAQKDDNYRIVATSYRLVVNVNYTLRITPLETRRPITPAVATEQIVYVLFPKYQGGKLVTNSKDYIQEMLANKERYKAKVIFSDETKDLAIVQLSSLPPEVEALPLAAESAKQGQSVHSVGNPGASSTGPGPFAGPGPASPSFLESFWVYTSGTVRTNPYPKQWVSGGATVMKHNATIIETQSPTNPGDSGGPLVNEWGELVGVTQGSNVEVDALSRFGAFGGQVNWVNIFIDVSEVKAVLKTKGYRWVPPTKEVETVRTSLTLLDVKKLGDLLDHDSSEVRTRAAVHLAEGGKTSRQAVPALAKSLSDKEAEVRRTAAIALGAIGAESATSLPQLTRTLKDKDRFVRIEAIKAIHKIGPKGPELATAIGDLLTDADAELQGHGLTALAKIGKDAKHALPGLTKVLEGPDPKLQKLALGMMEQLGPEAREAAPTLQKVLDKTDATTKTRIVRLLASWDKTGDTAKLLIPQLKDPDKTVCLESLKTLEKLGKAAKPAAPEIGMLYRRHKDLEIRTQSLKTLAAMGPAAAEVVPALIRDVLDPGFRFEYKALHDQLRETLVRIGPPAAEALAKTLAGGKIGARTTALEIIGEIGPDAAAVLPILRKHPESEPGMQKLLRATIEQLQR